MSQLIEIFCCAAESDQPFLEKLSIQLALQQQQGVIELWDKSQISPGAAADEEIRPHLTSAHIFLLLISADFLADSYCYDLVLKTALERHTRGEALTMPVIVRPAHYQDVGVLQNIEVLPRGGKPISSHPNEDEALWEVTKEIRKVIKRLGSQIGSEAKVERRQNEKLPSLQPRSRPNSGVVLSRKMTSVIVVLAILLVVAGGSYAWIENASRMATTPTVMTDNQATATARMAPTATANAAISDYNRHVSQDGIMFGFNAQHTGTNPYERILNAVNVSKMTEKWDKPVGDCPTSQNCFTPTPAIANGIVYIGSTDGKLYAFDAMTGELKWTAPTGGTIVDSSPAVANGIVYIGSTDGKLYAFDAMTGHQRWTYSTGNMIRSAPTIANGLIYIGSNDATMYAFDAMTGQKRWTAPIIAPGGGSIDTSSPAVANGVVYVGAGDKKLYAFDATSGQQKWAASTGDWIDSSPVVADGIVYVGSHDGKLYALDAASGQVKWTHPDVAAGGWTSFASPAVANNVVYFSSDQLYAFDAITGEPKWAVPLAADADSSPVVANGVVYVDSDKLYAFDAASGLEKRAAFVEGPNYSSPVVANGVVYVGSRHGKLYAFSL